MEVLKNYKSSIFNFFLCFFPVSLIIGNQAININIFFLIVFSLVFYSKEIIKIKFNSYDKLLIIFFLYIGLTLIFNYFTYYIENKIFFKLILFKTIFFYKYLLLYIVIRFFFHQKIFNLKLFYSICAICAIIVSFDIFFQFIFGHNILGIKPTSVWHYSSFFGEELIAGGYLQRFSLFAIFFPFLLKKNKYSFLFFLFLIIFIITIALSGNRMPLFLYLISILIFLVLKKNSIRYIFVSFLIIFTILFSLYNLNIKFKKNISFFYLNSKNIISSFLIMDYKNPAESILKKPYVSEFLCAKTAIEKNPIFGSGIKSFRSHSKYCNTHPHNYFLEITSELGLIGLLILIFFVYKLCLFIVKNIWYSNFSDELKNKILPVFLLILIEFFPFRSSGSFFTTGNASIIFIFLAILVSLISTQNQKS